MLLIPNASCMALCLRNEDSHFLKADCKRKKAPDGKLYFNAQRGQMCTQDSLRQALGSERMGREAPGVGPRPRGPQSRGGQARTPVTVI